MNSLPRDAVGFEEMSSLSGIGRYWLDSWETGWVARGLPGLRDFRSRPERVRDVKERVARSYYMLGFF